MFISILNDLDIQLILGIKNILENIIQYVLKNPSFLGGTYYITSVKHFLVYQLANSNMYDQKKDKWWLKCQGEI